jgi:hypothetical protein
MRLRTALASASGADWSLKGEQEPVCDKGKFAEMRDMAYERFGLPHVPVAQQRQLVLTVMVKEAHDKRKAIVPQAVAHAVQVRRCLCCGGPACTPCIFDGSPRSGDSCSCSVAGLCEGERHASSTVARGGAAPQAQCQLRCMKHLEGGLQSQQ